MSEYFDVIIVGAGIAGTGLAYHSKRKSKSLESSKASFEEVR